MWPRAVPAITLEEEILIAWQRAARSIEVDDADPFSVCIVTANPDHLSKEAIIAHKPSELPFGAIKLTGDYADSPHAVSVGTMSEVKGFEFSVMIVVGCGASGFPSPGRAPDEIWRDALRLYVAMTRARDEVYLVYSGEPSAILTKMNAHIEWETDA